MIEALGNFWATIIGAFAEALAWLHDGFAAFADPQNLAWGLAIIGLTVIIRLLLMPLAVKQIRSMRAMQDLQPKIKELQDKYDTDRDLIKKDPERYQAQKQKLNEEMMALYREEGVNPAMGCLPLLAQLPVFIALFDVLQSDNLPAIQGMHDATFLFLPGLGTQTSAAGLAGWVMIGLMVVTMFLAQRQMMASRGGGTAALQQKLMMFGMPVFLAFVAQSFPLGVLLYWVTTNIFQFGQQALIMREVGDGEDEDGEPDQDGGKATGSSTVREKLQQALGGAGSGDVAYSDESGSDGSGGSQTDASSEEAASEDEGTAKSSRERRGHIPSRPS